MKKFVVLILALLMLVSSFVACAKVDEKLLADQEKIIQQLGYSYYNELMIVSKELSGGERVYYCLGFDDNDVVDRLVICRFFTSEKAYESKYKDVQLRVGYGECKLLRVQKDILMFAYNDDVVLADVKGKTYLDAQKHYKDLGWTYVKRQNSSSEAASSSESN